MIYIKKIIWLLFISFSMTLMFSCMPYKSPLASRLEYSSPVPLNRGNRDLSVQSRVLKEQLFKKIALVAEKHFYDATDCSLIRDVRKEGALFCYKHKEKEKNIILSYNGETRRFIIFMSADGAAEDPSVMKLKSDLERELKGLLGNPLTQ